MLGWVRRLGDQPLLREADGSSVGQAERVRQEFRKRRRRPAGADETIQKVGCAGFLFGICVAGGEVRSFQIISQRMIFGISAWDGFELPSLKGQRIFERPAILDLQPSSGLSSDRVANLCQRWRFRMPDANAAVDAARLEV